MKWSVEQIAVLKASITAGDNVYLRLNEGAAPEKVVRIEEDELDGRVHDEESIQRGQVVVIEQIAQSHISAA